MQSITIFHPQSVDEVVQTLKSYPGLCLILAGGTDLLPDLRKRKKDAHVLIDINRIAELHQIRVEEDQVIIGAAVTFAEIHQHLLIQERVAMLAEAALSVGALPLQNSATWVGNLVQAMPAADGAIVALALEAEVQINSAHGSEWRKVETLFQSAGVSAIDPSQHFISCIRFSIPKTSWGGAWQRLGRRSALTLPILNCAVKLEIINEIISHAVIALGPVAPIPMRARSAERYLMGKSLEEHVVEQAALLAQAESHPRSNLLRASAQYRKSVIPVLVRRALHIAWERAHQTKSILLEPKGDPL
ncbi:MAG: FAD binding domain-containing protein [Anaerolineales bacterium]